LNYTRQMSESRRFYRSPHLNVTVIIRLLAVAKSRGLCFAMLRLAEKRSMLRKIQFCKRIVTRDVHFMVFDKICSRVTYLQIIC